MPDSASTLYAIRHGSTSFDVHPERIQSWDNGGLSKKGLAEAQQASDRLIALSPSEIVTSDLRRAVETANIVREHHPDVPLIRTSEIRPWNLGDWEGKVADEYENIIVYHIRMPDKIVQGGESFNFYLRRVTEFFARLLARKGIFIAITHSWAMRFLEEWTRSGFRREDMDLNNLMPNGNGTKVKPGQVVQLKAIGPTYTFKVL